MKLLTLCSGIGAPELAATWMGWTCALTCEVDPFCNRVLAHHYPGAYHHGDIKTLTGKIVGNELSKRFGRNWNEGTVLVAGFPCQPFSLAGKRLGAEDDRHLWPEVLRLVGEIRPRWFVGENVAGILSMVLPGHEVKVGSHEDVAGESYEEVEVREQSVVERVCSDLESIGYSVVPVVIPACAVGAPHRRDRVWFLASDSNRSGLQAAGTEQPPTGTARGGQQRTSSHTECGRGDEMDDQIQPGQSNGAGIDGNGRERPSPHPDGQRRSELDASPVASQTSKRPAKYGTEIPNWENFPATQPAIRSGDDGVSGRLLGITFPKWRSESIRALGNSMVAPLLYEIFLAIQNVEYGNMGTNTQI